MDPQEILHEIVKTDLEARVLYDEAVRQQSALSESLREKTAELRREYFAKADERVAEFEKREIANADAEIAAIDGKFNRNHSRLVSFFEDNKGKIALKLFNIVIGQDEGENA